MKRDSMQKEGIYFMRICKTVLLISLSIFLLVACSSNNESSKSGSKSSSYDIGSNGKETEQSTINPSTKTKQDSEKNLSVQSRKVIYNASLQMEVKHLPDVQDKIRDLTGQMGGYIVDQKMNEETKERQEGYLTVRIPQEQFQAFLRKVKPLGAKVENQSISGQDVTEEYVDLQSRLKSKKVTEKRLTQFMNEAKDTKTLLEISNELSKVQEEMEMLEGKIKYLNNQVDYSTVAINLYEDKVVVPELEKNQLNTWEKTKKQFMSSINFLASFLSWLIIFIIGNLPVIALLILIGFIIYFIWRHRNKQSNNNTIEK
ncbi:DUF4349 domain-containing protein [Heyndrickxia camelliae]|uniref:DUF4349 domain-containing protein n=2 Tax=Heyndrickxia camelliae TaxID=1707093 RepID=A0A2N3LLI5_9BACI|nr:DUF4349 domain-containing protein [Heyndrickxia camelliae]